MSGQAIRFADFVVTNQVFYRTRLSFALVNIRPLLPGHVLVCPLRRVPRFNDLTVAEVTDLFQAVRLVSRTVERVYKADALNIAIQDGPLAGQSVPHVHCHIIPRRLNDLPNVDDIYGMLNHNDIDKAFRAIYERSSEAGISGVDSQSRQNRTPEEMIAEADMLKENMTETLDSQS